jgi:hypothetical protein
LYVVSGKRSLPGASVLGTGAAGLRNFFGHVRIATETRGSLREDAKTHRVISGRGYCLDNDTSISHLRGYALEGYVMATTDRRFQPKSSNWLIFAVSTAVAIAVGVMTYQPVRDVGNVESDVASPACLEADRESVARLAALLERNGPAHTAVLERANHTLSVARRHCLYGWQGRALEDYEWLRQWLNEQG